MGGLRSLMLRAEAGLGEAVAFYGPHAMVLTNLQISLRPGFIFCSILSSQRTEASWHTNLGFWAFTFDVGTQNILFRELSVELCIKNISPSRVLVVHTCNPSYLGG
jgi:hypothetical protein